jgi:hypothetical protein
VPFLVLIIKRGDMKKKLEEKLKNPKIDRKFKWFWSNYVRPNNGITYQYFMEMLNGNTPLRDDVKETITTFINRD